MNNRTSIPACVVRVYPYVPGSPSIAKCSAILRMRIIKMSQVKYGTSQYNRATQARRQPGSTFKPFVYLTAFEATFDDPSLPPITPATVVEDAPTTFIFGNREYRPENYEDKYLGYVTLRRALAHSLNNATVKVAEMVGYDRVASLWNRKLGMPSQVQPYPAVALGAFEATPLEMATAFNVLATGGLKVEPATVLSVIDEHQTALPQHSP